MFPLVYGSPQRDIYKNSANGIDIAHLCLAACKVLIYNPARLHGAPARPVHTYVAWSEYVPCDSTSSDF